LHKQLTLAAYVYFATFHSTFNPIIIFFSSTRHPSLMLFMGFVFSPKEKRFGLVSPFMKRGSLFDVLHKPVTEVRFLIVSRESNYFLNFFVFRFCCRGDIESMRRWMLRERCCSFIAPGMCTLISPRRLFWYAFALILIDNIYPHTHCCV
jgi:hypothetical protein